MNAGQTHHRAKFSDQKVEEARTLRDNDPDTWTHSALAARFGCSMSTMRDWLNYSARTGGNEIRWNT